jgi:hydroxyacylglutathione hydrolase
MPLPAPLSAGEFEARAKSSFILDTRMELSFASGHIPGSQSIWLDGLASFEGWFLPYDRPILLVNETDDSAEATRILIREGYDNLAGSLSGDMLNWHMSGRGSASIKTITVQELYMRMGGGEPTFVLDVRSDEELAKDGRMPGAIHIHITQLPARLKEVPRKKPVYIFCGSGLRSMIGASFLQRNGWTDLTVVLGGMSAWKSMENKANK